MVLSGIIFAAIMPHPPIAVPEIGGSRIAEIAATERAAEQVARDIVAAKPDLIIVFTPHGEVDYQRVNVYKAKKFTGSFANFGLPNLKYSFPGDTDLTDKLLAELKKEKAPVAELNSATLDHGVLVPLSFIKRAGYDGAILPMAIAVRPLPELFEFGQVLQRAIAKSGKRVVIIGSADMSHRLTAEAPSGYSPQGKIFDQRLVALVKKNDVDSILHFEDKLAEAAGQDALWSVAMVLGCVDGLGFSQKVLSYEGPFGVGYMVVEYKVTTSDVQGQKVEKNTMNPLVKLAWDSIESFVKKGKTLTPPAALTPEMSARAGVFVSIHKKNGELRGCIGTFAPTRANVAQEIIADAISAATQDPRFPPIEADELSNLDISVDVLSAPEPVASTKELNAKKYGVIVSAGYRRGLLLPDLRGVNTPEQQIEICRMKGGIGPNEPVKLQRFEVKRYY